MKTRECIILGTILLVGLLVRLYFYTGLYGFDDLKYSHYGYFLFEPSEVKDAVVRQWEGQMYLRMGVNLPLWAATRVFGVHEWSVVIPSFTLSMIGIVCVWAVLRRLVDSAAGLTGAALTAVLPADVYLAGICQPDGIFGGLQAIFVLLLVLALSSEKYRFWFAFLAGLALGFDQYVKESMLFAFGPLLVWTIYHSWRSRRIEWLMAFVVLGWLATQILMGILFWVLKDDFNHFWPATIRFWTTVEARTLRPTQTWGQVLAHLKREHFVLQGLGLGFFILPVTLLAMLLDQRWKHRFLLTGLCLVQCYAVFRVVCFAYVSQRYMMHWSIFFVIITVLGVRSLTDLLGLRWSKRLWPLVSAALIVATVASLSHSNKQLRPEAGNCYRTAFTYLDANAGKNDKIFVDYGNRAYSHRALFFLNGFEDFKGGFSKLEDSKTASAGWVVLGFAEKAVRGKPYELASNWLEVCRVSTRNAWVRVFRILPVKPDYRLLTPHPDDVVPEDSSDKASPEAAPRDSESSPLPT